MSGTGIFGNVSIGTPTPGPNLKIFDSNAGAHEALTLQTRSSACSATVRRSSTSSAARRHSSVSIL
jgi:hypothetical protein